VCQAAFGNRHASSLHRRHGDRRVHVIRNPDGHRVETITQRAEHLAVVGEVLHTGMRIVGLVEAIGIHIAEADEFHRGM
jgi:hypothetical protein